MALWKVGFMKQLPNLLKQESSSAATLINVLVRLHGDRRPSHRSLRAKVRKTLVPLGEAVVNSYLPLDPETQGRNVAAWTPVVAEVFSGLCTFHDVTEGEEINDEESASSAGPRDMGGQVFTHHAKIFYPLAVDLLSREPLPTSIGEALRTFFYKVGVAQGMIDEQLDRERRRRIQEGRDREKGLRTVSLDTEQQQQQQQQEQQHFRLRDPPAPKTFTGDCTAGERPGDSVPVGRPTSADATFAPTPPEQD